MGRKRTILQSKLELTGSEAATLLAELADNDVSPVELLQIGVVNGLRAFVRLGRFEYTGVDTEIGLWFEVAGLYEVVQGFDTKHTSEIAQEPDGAVLMLDADCVLKGPNEQGRIVELTLYGEDGNNDTDYIFYEPLLFKPADIQALADKLNSTTPIAKPDNDPVANQSRIDTSSHGDMTNGCGWQIVYPRRSDGLNHEIVRILEKAQAEGQNAPPKAKRVAEFLRQGEWSDFISVSADGVIHLDSHGQKTETTFESIRKRIQRMTETADKTNN